MSLGGDLSSCSPPRMKQGGTWKVPDELWCTEGLSQWQPVQPDGRGEAGRPQNASRHAEEKPIRLREDCPDTHVPCHLSRLAQEVWEALRDVEPIARDPPRIGAKQESPALLILGLRLWAVSRAPMTFGHLLASPWTSGGIFSHVPPAHSSSGSRSR